MNNRQLYLAWLRSNAPTLYMNVVRKVTGRTRSLGGLADDLINKSFAPDLAHSFLGDDTGIVDESALQGDAPSTDLTTIPAFDSSMVSAPAPVNIASGTATGVSPSSSNSIFGNILQAVAAVGVGVVNATNQSKLIALNTTRAAQGLPPINANGQIVTGAGLSTTSPSLLAFERAISGGASGSMLPILLLGGGLIAAFALMGRRS
jgi:hypothetical protein